MIINTRDDLDHLVGTEDYSQFISYLKGSILTKRDTQVYPADYNQVGYVGALLDPIWIEVEDLTTITNFGFTKEQLA